MPLLLGQVDNFLGHVSIVLPNRREEIDIRDVSFGDEESLSVMILDDYGRSVEQWNMIRYRIEE